ncbi:hypothetical protein PROH_00245 [Prochlorothrix hollandica PCC 9006 = CALU 1027]|uniref:Uncharacterized protein n=1 Tax=Prochlorothrix hollandica PCC 9006 = CALU 1027 TaxID=317619 RepID=A0A0M2Q1T7_PROHO|nr:hypothetical protein PROH_00245 [Prochlorothrix hollandica PCC 9006 = CALU 1027]
MLHLYVSQHVSQPVSQHVSQHVSQPGNPVRDETRTWGSSPASKSPASRSPASLDQSPTLA